MDENIRKFKLELVSFRSIYRSVELKIMAYKTNGNWINLATQVILRPIPDTEVKVKRRLPKLTNLIVIHKAISFGNFNSILNEISNSRLTVNNIEIKYGQENNKQLNLGQHFSIYKYERVNQRFRRFMDEDYTQISLSSSAIPFHSLPLNYRELEEIDRNLKSLKRPYNGIDEIMRDIFHINRPADGNWSTYTEIIAPIYLRFGGNTSLNNGILYLEIEFADSMEIGKIDIGIIKNDKRGEKRRLTIKLDEFEIKRKKGILILGKEIRNCVVVSLFLRYNGFAVDSIELHDHDLDKTGIVSIHKKIDPDFQRLIHLLSGKGKKKEKGFESGINMLLALFGFCCLPYFQLEGLQDFADGVAILPETQLGIVFECTISFPDNKSKLAKLFRRTREILSRNPKIKIKPVIFTALSEDEISTSQFNTASKDNIVLVPKEGIEKMVKWLQEGREARFLFNNIDNLTYDIEI